eukprot:15463649-Alexandrium_andersonii.AAC.1
MPEHSHSHAVRGVLGHSRELAMFAASQAQRNRKCAAVPTPGAVCEIVREGQSASRLIVDLQD